MGTGQVGSDGSVHWVVAYDDVSHAPISGGADPLAHGNIGHGGNGPDKGHGGTFRLSLRFDSAQAAANALGNALRALPGIGVADLNRALAGVAAGGAGFVATLDVPVTLPRRANPMSNLPWEIVIDW